MSCYYCKRAFTDEELRTGNGIDHRSTASVMLHADCYYQWLVEVKQMSLAAMTNARSDVEQHRQHRIHLEVEAMPWPDKL
jgi:hypothetical protein